MSWPRVLKDYRKYEKVIARVDGVAITIPLIPPHYKWFGFDSKTSEGIYVRYNQDERMAEPKHKFVSIPYSALHRYEVIQ